MNVQFQAQQMQDERARREAEIRLEQERQREEQRRQQEEMRRRNAELSRSQAGQASQVGLGGNMGGGPNPMMMQKFMGGGAGGGGGAAASSGGSSSAAGGLGAAVPWAALAAAIVGNEYFANKDGRRPESKSKWGTELLTGKVLERDMDYYGDKVGGIGGQALKGIGQLGNPEGTLKFIKKLF